MNVWRCLGTALFVVVLGLGVSAQGQDKGKKPDPKQVDKGKKPDPKQEDKGKKEQPTAGDAKLVWKAFDEADKPFYQEMTTVTTQTMKVQQMSVNQKQSQTFYIKWTPKKKEKDNYVVEQKIIGVTMDIEIGGNKISYDSRLKDQPANPLTDFFKALVGSEFTLTIDPKTMKVIDVKGRKEFIDSLSKANPQLKPLLEAILSEDALKQMADPVFSAIPEGGVVPKDKTWNVKSTLNMGPIGSYTTKYDYKFEGEKGDIANIGVKTELTYEAPKGKGTDGLPFRITNADLKSDKDSGTGTVQFDTKRGRIAGSTMNLKLGGKLSIDIAGMTTEVDLQQTQESSLKTSDTDPTQQKKQ